jgi:NACalpha-BTF3-like transcription factor
MDNARMAKNIQAITSSVKYIVSQNGKLAAQTDVLILGTGELKELFPWQAKSVKDLGVKMGRVTQVSNTVIETQKNIIIQVRDSLVQDTVWVKVFSYQDQWYQITGVSDNGTQQLKIQSTDTLTQLVYKGEREKPWLWIFSPRKLQQRVSVSNPNSTIKYSSIIQIHKP